MSDILDFAMETSGSARTTTVSRKPRRSTRPSSDAVADPVLSEIFMGINEQGVSRNYQPQRSESDDKSATKASLQQGRPRAHRSGGERTVLKKSQTAALSVSKNESVGNASSTHAGDVVVRENSSVVRQSLTSSASRVRPSKQQAHRSVRPSVVVPPQRGANGSASYNSNNNNDNEDEEPILEEAHTHMMLPHSHNARGSSEWEVLYGVNQAGQLPSRSRRYLNISAGSDRSSVDLCDQMEEDPSSNDGLLADRPPSRQRHAFPTHLLDARDFFSPVKPADSSAHAAAITITPWHNDDEDARDEDDDAHSPACSSPEDREEDEDSKQTNRNLQRQRPPSRYMTKAPRGGSSSSSISSNSTDDSHPNGRLPSRRGVAGSWNQAAQHHHDPKTDGFADVDESVPPPFRVEITTNSYHSQYIPADHRRADEERRHSLKSRRASSFGSRAQLNNLQKQNSLYGNSTSADQSKRPMDGDLQWCGQDTEAYVGGGSRPAPGRLGGRAGQMPSYGLTRSVVQPSGIVDNNFTHHGNTSMTSSQWFRANNNPFFVSHPGVPATGNECMDAETAIANTPLFSGEEDLMAITQLSDLCLDDFMGDTAYSGTSTVIQSAQQTAQPATTLNTSLGRDFLNLFAQH